jgi:hypothetical protein
VELDGTPGEVMAPAIRPGVFHTRGGSLVKRRIIAAALAIVAATAAAVGGAAPAFADDHFDVGIQNWGNEKCLAPQGESYADGVAIVQVPCTGSVFQRWDFIDHDNHVFQIRNAATLKCFDALGGATNGTAVVQWPCASISNQRWQASRDLPDFVYLRSRVAGTSSHCLDVPGDSNATNQALQIYVCNNTEAQYWGVGVGIHRS